MAARARRDASGHRRFRATTVKVMQDGICENYTAAMLAPYRKNALADHPWKAWKGQAGEGVSDGGDGEQRMPGGKSRWSGGKDLSWEPIRAELVVEVAYDHMQGTRFRHATHFKRWRPD